MADVGEWLAALGLDQYAATFAAQQIDGDVLADLTDADLQALGLPLGPRKKLLRAIAVLREGPPEPKSPGGRGRRAAARPAPRSGPERRNLTVLVCDLVGSTSLATHCDPEELRVILHGYMDACSAVVASLGGLVARYHGDGLMAYFGYPEAREDAAERAVRAGLGIVEAVRAVPGVPAVRLRTRVGIATGLAVVGDLIGEGAAREEAVVGETPALAARLQTLAPPESVVVSQTTRDLLGAAFALETMGPKVLKGFDRPQTVWRVIGVERTESRFAAAHCGAASELVDRDSELAVLRSRWSLAAAGRGQVVLMTGEAGLGKSRLVQALRESLVGQAYRPVLLQCASYSQTSALRPVIEWIDREAGFAATDSAETRRAKLRDLPGLTGDAAEVVAGLLSLADGGAATSDPTRRRERTLTALSGLLVGGPPDPPRLVVLEDAHWSDAFTLDLLARAVERVGTQPVMLLVTTRPDMTPEWARRPDVIRLHLDRLEPEHVARLIELVAVQDISPDMRARIAERADGVPLFVEELARSVAEAGNQTVSVPATLQDTLMARLDRLGPAKAIAQAAAVLGREFHFRWLATCTGVARQRLVKALGELVASGLATARGEPPDAMYAFKHALVQDAAYYSMLRSDRARIHGEIARMLETRFARIAAEQPELVAHHHSEAGATAAAITWWERAGAQAARQAAATEAVRHYQSALRLLASLPANADRDTRETALRVALQPELTNIGGYGSPDSEANLDRLAKLLENAPPSLEAVGMLYSQAALRLLRSELTTAEDVAHRCLQLARRSTVPNAQVLGQRIIGYVALVRGDVAEAARWFKISFDEFDPSHGRLIWVGRSLDTLATMMAQDIVVAIQTGRLDTAAPLARAALAEAERHAANPLTIAYVLVHVGLRCIIVGDAQDAAPAAAMLLETVPRAEWLRGHAETLAGWQQAKTGGVDEGRARMHHGREIAIRIHDRVWLPLYAASEIEILVENSRHEEALAASDKCLRLIAQFGQGFALPEVHRLRGTALEGAGASSAAIETEFRIALEIARRGGLRLYELRAATSLARLLMQDGRAAEAQSLLAPVVSRFTEGFDTADLRAALAVLAELATAGSTAGSG